MSLKLYGYVEKYNLDESNFPWEKNEVQNDNSNAVINPF